MYRFKLINLGSLDKLPRQFKNIELDTVASIIDEALFLSKSGCLSLSISKEEGYSLNIIATDQIPLQSICYPYSAFQYFLKNCGSENHDVVVSMRDNAFYSRKGECISVMDDYLVEPRKVRC